jgi:serine phosphatase RsbU (regulator of sigma subunit)/anti-sigma regulatory factor (Ser/Thr protein kinase)
MHGLTSELLLDTSGDAKDPERGAGLGIMSLIATLLAIVPLCVAVGVGCLGYSELRDALTFDVRGLHALAVRSEALRLALAQDAAIEQYATTGRPVFRQHYLSAQRPLALALRELATISSDPTITGGQASVAVLYSLYDRWSRTVAGPIAKRSRPVGEDRRTRLRDIALIGDYRSEIRKLGRAIRDHIVLHQRSFSSQLFHIAMLFLGSIAMAVLGVGLGAVQLRLLERRRQGAEAALRERELLHARDRSWSRSFARAVLPPRLPVVTGCRFDAVYEPGANDRQVGGDWYDAMQLVDGRILVSIGDVAGSGVEAAVVMGVARQIMRGIAQLHADPALMLDAADRALRLEHDDVFVTAWVGVIDLVTRRLVYASAGHPPALLAWPDGTLVELRDGALPLGVREGHQARSTRLELPDGALLVLYTDGLSEATHDVLVGETRVRAAASAIASLPWSAPAREMQRRVLAEAATDDVAILVSRFDLQETERCIRRMTCDASDMDAARALRAAFLAVLRERDFRPADYQNAELVFGELLGNVVRHADGDRRVEIAIDCGGARTVLHVFDWGPGFRHSSRLPADPYAESGRGLFIVAALTLEFTVTEREGRGSHARATLVGGSPEPLMSSPSKTPKCVERAAAASVRFEGAGELRATR